MKTMSRSMENANWISSHHFQTVLLVKSALQRPDQLRSGSRCQPSTATAGDLPGKSTVFNSRAGNYTANLVPHRSNTPSHLPTEPESRTLQLGAGYKGDTHFALENQPTLHEEGNTCSPPSPDFEP